MALPKVWGTSSVLAVTGRGLLLHHSGAHLQYCSTGPCTSTETRCLLDDQTGRITRHRAYQSHRPARGPNLPEFHLTPRCPWTIFTYILLTVKSIVKSAEGAVVSIPMHRGWYNIHHIVHHTAYKITNKQFCKTTSKNGSGAYILSDIVQPQANKRKIHKLLTARLSARCLDRFARMIVMRMLLVALLALSATAQQQQLGLASSSGPRQASSNSLLWPKTAVTDSCVTNPLQSNCTTFTYPNENAAADLNKLCHAMHFMASCSVAKACNASGAGPEDPSGPGAAKVSKNNPNICSPFNQVATVCSLDTGMGRMMGECCCSAHRLSSRLTPGQLSSMHAAACSGRMCLQHADASVNMLY